MNIKELDCVVLTADLPDKDLKAGTEGTVVLIHRNGIAYEVEFFKPDGETIAVATVRASDVRRLTKRDIARLDKERAHPRKQKVKPRCLDWADNYPLSPVAARDTKLTIKKRIGR